MNEIQDIFNKNSDISVKDILSHSGEQNKKKVTYSRFYNQPILSTSKYWRGDFFQPLTLSQEQKKAIGESCFFCSSKSTINHYDNLILEEATGNNAVVCVCSLCQLPRYLGQTLLEGKGTVSFVKELSQTEINNISRYVILSAYVNDLPSSKLDKLHINNEFSAWLKDSYSELQGLNAALTLNSESVFKHLNAKNAAFNVYLAEILSHIKTSNPETYANRQNIFKNVVIIPTGNAYSEQEKLVLLKEGTFSKKAMDSTFTKMEEWTK